MVLIGRDLKVKSWGWREGSAVRKTFCPSRGAGFGSQLLHRGSESAVNSDPGDPALLSGIHGHLACLTHTSVWVGNTFIHEKRKINNSKIFILFFLNSKFLAHCTSQIGTSPACEFVSLGLSSLMESQFSSAVSLRIHPDCFSLTEHPRALGLVVHFSIWLWFKSEKAKAPQLENSNNGV